MVWLVQPCLPASHILPDARPGLAAGTAQLGELSSRDDPARLVRAWARDAPAPVTTSADASVSSTTEIDASSRAWPAARSMVPAPTVPMTIGSSVTVASTPLQDT